MMRLLNENNYQKVELVNTDGNKFTVFLSEYEVHRAENDNHFLEELLNKYSTLRKNSLIAAHKTGNFPCLKKNVDMTKSNDTDVKESNEPPQDEVTMEEQNDQQVSGDWNEYETRLLIHLYAEHVDEFRNKKKKHVWTIISEKMCSEGIYKSAEKCQRKWINLTRVYRSLKNDNRPRKGGRGCTSYKFFDELDEILGPQASNSEEIYIFDVGASTSFQDAEHPSSPTSNSATSDQESTNSKRQKTHCSVQNNNTIADHKTGISPYLNNNNDRTKSVNIDGNENNESDEFIYVNIDDQNDQQVSGDWNENETKLLIHLYAEHADEFRHQKKKHVWSIISEEMCDKGIYKSAEKCQRKWINLTRVYRSVLNRPRKLGRRRRPFYKFFDALDEILRQPPSNSEDTYGFEAGASTSLQEAEHPSSPTSNSATSDQEITHPKTKKRNYSREYYKKKLEMREKERELKQQRYQEKIDIERKRNELEEQKIILLKQILLKLGP